ARRATRGPQPGPPAAADGRPDPALGRRLLPPHRAVADLQLRADPGGAGRDLVRRGQCSVQGLPRVAAELACEATAPAPWSAEPEGAAAAANSPDFGMGRCPFCPNRTMADSHQRAGSGCPGRDLEWNSHGAPTGFAGAAGRVVTVPIAVRAPRRGP